MISLLRFYMGFLKGLILLMFLCGIDTALLIFIVSFNAVCLYHV